MALKLSEVMRKALEKLGANGELWIKGAERSPTKDGKMAFCSIGAINQICRDTGSSGMTLSGHTPDSIFRHVSIVNGKKFCSSVVGLNDHHETTFADVKATFERAIEAAVMLEQVDEKTAEQIRAAQDELAAAQKALTPLQLKQDAILNERAELVLKALERAAAL